MKTYGLIGKPLGHSFSQKYFSEKFNREGINATYGLYELPTIHDFPSLCATLQGLVGINVTIPYKTAVIPYLDALSPEAEAIGAVNVIRIENGKKTGYNSDVYGFRTSLQKALEGRELRQAVILGTGGASKAVAYVLKTEYGIETPIQVSRSPGRDQIGYQELPRLKSQDFQLVVNATPLGTYPHIENCPPFPFHLLGEEHLAFDLVYNPPETLFLKRARAQGARGQNGLEMLHLQAEKAWEIWEEGVCDLSD